MVNESYRRVVFQPMTYEGLQKGVDQIVNAVRPTLGPLPRTVAIEGTVRDKMPELLDNGGIIARRIIQLTDRDADMGAMFLRQMMWDLHERVGDGTATAAVLFQAIFNRGIRYIVSGGNSMRLRYYLEQGKNLILEQIVQMTQQVEGKVELARVAETICHDPALSKMLGEIFDIIGEYGIIEVRKGSGRGLEREYHEGIYWKSKALSREMVGGGIGTRSDLSNVAILASDLEINDHEDLIPILDDAITGGIKSLLIVAKTLSTQAIAVLLSASKDPKDFNVVGVKVPGLTADDHAASLEDLVVLTGGRAVLQVAGDTLPGLKSDDLGRARKAWIEPEYFGITAGRGDPRALRSHIAILKGAFNQASDSDDRKRLQERIGKLMGGSATLYIGGDSEHEINPRIKLAERTAQALRSVVREGVVPGGAVSLLACRPSIEQAMADSTDSDERAAYHILSKAIDEPFRVILSNAAQDPSRILARIGWSETGNGFDVRTGKIVDMAEAGIWDSAAVQSAVVHSAISSAALALTTDVLVHHKKPKQAFEP